uniref:Protein quiver n=1 Tax=Macrostomum lignano TaxID=282301 RepID=A0A1I8GAM6_9PLAT
MKLQFWLVVFISQCSIGRLGFSSDPDFCREQIVNCIECDTSVDPNCRDPFDMTLVKQGLIPSVRCLGVCSKWVYSSGDTKRIRRTCSNKLELKKVSPYLVCIDESRGRGGSLCFCDRRNCNAAVCFASPSVALAVGAAAATVAALADTLGRLHSD